MKKIIYCFLLLIPSASTSFAQNFLELAGLSPNTHYRTFDTEHFHFVYQDGYFEFTQKAATHFEHAHEILSPILKWKPRGKTDILIADNEDSANGFALPALRVGIVLIATPPDVWFSTSYSDDWIKLLAFHEYTHFLNIDPTTEWMEWLRIFYGDIIKPNGLWPVWMLEGLAVYFETRTSKLGRGRSPYYESILRAYVNENRLGTQNHRSMTLDRVNGDYPYFPGGEIPYLFGYHLWEQLSKDHGLQKNTEAAMGELSIRSSARVPYFIEGNLENVMNKNWVNYWDSFVSESKDHFSKQIAAVKAKKETPSTRVAQSDYSALGGVISPSGKYLAYTESSMQELTSLVILDLETKKKTYVSQKILGVGMSFTQDSKYLIYSSLERTGSFSLFSDLFLYHLASGKITALTHGLRAKDPSLSPDGKSIAFVRTEHATNFLATANVVLEDEQMVLKDLKTIYSPKKFSILGSPKFISTNEVVFSLQEIGKTESILKITGVDGKSSRTLFSDGQMSRYPVFDSGKVYFVSDRTGVENIYSIDLLGKNLKQVTNVITGVQLPFFSPTHDLHASLMSSDGFQIVRFNQKNPLESFSDKIALPHAPAPLDSALKEKSLPVDESKTESYSPWSSLAPRQWAPLAYYTYASRTGSSLGGFALGFDSTGKQQYYLSAGYHSKPNTFDGSLDYTLYYFRPVVNFSASMNTSDIATDVTQSQYRRSKEVGISFSYPIFWNFSSLKPSLYGFLDWNQIRDLNSGRVINTSDFEYANPVVPGFGGSLVFSNAQKSKLGFIPEQGNTLKIAAENKLNSNRFSVIKALASLTHYFGFGNNSVLVSKGRWLQSSHTTGFEKSFAKVEGKHRGEIFDQGQSLSLNQMSIRGYSDTSRLRKSAGSLGLDYHFPLSRAFVGLGNTTPAFIKQLHGFIFGEGTYIPRGTILPETVLPAYGAGVALDTSLLIRAPLTFSLQYQNGTKKDFGGDSLLFFSIEAASLF